MTLDDKIEVTATHVVPYVRSIARVVRDRADVHGNMGPRSCLDFPRRRAPGPFTLLCFAAIIEIVGGALLALGLWTRLAAFIMSGETASAIL
jgi:putative oxidoreductase